MLEVGCGMAKILRYLPEGIHYWGIDPTEECIRKLRIEEPRHNFLVGHAENLPFDNDNFGLVFSVQVLEHVTGPKQSLKEMVRVLKPGGYLIIIVPNLETPWSTIHTIRQLSVFIYHQEFWFLCLR